MNKNHYDLILKVNEQTFYCSQITASESSPLIRDYLATSNPNLKNQELNMRVFDTTITDISNNEDLSILKRMINNEKIEITKDNYIVSLKIGRHFLMENIVEQCTRYHQSEMLIDFLNHDKNFQIQLKLEKILIELNEMNFNDIYNQCIDILSNTPFDCFYNLIVHIFLYSNNYIPKIHLLIQLLEKLEERITGIISSFINFILNIFSYPISSPKKMIYIKRIRLFVYEFWTKADSSFFKEGIPINSPNFGVPALLNDVFYYDKSKQMIKINKDNSFRNKSNLMKRMSYIAKEINSVFCDNKYNNIKYDYIKYYNIKYNNIKYNNIKYNNDKYNNDKYNNDKYNNDKYNNGDYNRNTTLLESIQSDDFDFLQKNILELDKNLFFSTTNQKDYYSLLECSAFFGAIKCFQFLINYFKEFDKNRLSLYAIAGGNTDIIHFCERNNCVFDQKSLKIAIIYHQHSLTKWLIETKRICIDQHISKDCILSYNIGVLNYMINRKIITNKILLDSISAGNIMLFRVLSSLENNGFSMKYNNGSKTALHIACEQNNVEIVKLLLRNENININAINEV